MDDNDESVRALTLKDDIDYDDPRQEVHDYGPGYTKEDDLDGDGKIDDVEHNFKVMDI